MDYYALGFLRPQEACLGQVKDREEIKRYGSHHQPSQDSREGVSPPNRFRELKRRQSVEPQACTQAQAQNGVGPEEVPVWLI